MNKEDNKTREKHEIIIKIEEGIQTKAFDNVIHKDAFERVKNLINQNLEKAKSYKPDNKNFERVHNTITVNGERGAGKTSFMLSIKKKYEDDNNIEVLDILDPTLISTKQHVFILLISMIEKKVNEKFGNKYREKRFEDKYKKWKESLEKLAKGLNQLDGVGKNPYADDLWDDSALVLAKGLSMAKGGLDLERKFHKFVYESLEILSDDKDNQKKAFLLFIDDIDTDFSKGWDVLEVLRKYITTPQIIPIMAGNFELYENLVRNEKSKLFKDLIEFEKNFDNFENKKILYNNQMDELTQQYLIKIMQPINMVNLHKLNYYLNFSNYNIKVDNENFNEFLKGELKKYFKYYYEASYIDNISKMPLRSIMQLLFFMKYSENKKDFIEKIRNLFLTYFVNLGIDMEFLDIMKDSQKGIDYFVYKFINIFDIENVKMFLPITADENKNKALFFIPQGFNIYLSFDKYIEWSIKVALQFYIVNLDKKAKELLLIENFVDNYERINNILKSIYLIGFKFKKSFLYVNTYRHKDYVFKDIGEKVYEEIKKELEKNENYFLFVLPYLGLKERNATFDAFSPLYILNLNFSILNENINVIVYEIKNFISKRISYENVINVNTSSEYEAEWDTEIEDLDTDEINIKEGFTLWIKEWIGILKELNFIEQFHLLKFNNLFFRYIDRNYKKIKPNLYCHLGEFIETEIFIFFNEIINNFVKNENIVINEIKTPNSIKKIFKNLEKIKSINENIYLFVLTFLLSPFIYPYISSVNRSLIKNFIKDLNIFEDLLSIIENNKELDIFNIYSRLNIFEGKCSKIPEEICKRELFNMLINNCKLPSIEEFEKRLNTKKRALPSKSKLNSYIKQLKEELEKYLKSNEVSDSIYKRLFEENKETIDNCVKDNSSTEEANSNNSNEAKK